MVATLTELIDRTTIRLSQVAGTSVQTYSEDKLGEMIQHKFDVLFDKAFWPQFCSWQTWTLDGTLGVVTADVSTILKRLEDLQFLYVSGAARPLPKLPEGTNPYLLRGSVPRAYDAYSSAAKVFSVYPAASTGGLVGRIRTKPGTFIAEDEVNFDEQVLILGACYDYLEDDGSNPGATAKFENLFNSRVEQLIMNKSSSVIPLDLASSPQTEYFTLAP